MFKKVISVLASAVVATSFMCGCSKTEESSFEMYYGQAMKEVDSEEIYLIYDGRYITDDEMSTVADYYDAIQKKDTKLFESTQNKEYLNFLEAKQGTGISNYLTSEYQAAENELGEGFDYTQIEVIDCGDATDDNGINDIKDLLDGIYEEAGCKKSFSETVKDEKYIIFDVTAKTSTGEEYTLPEELRYIFTCEDGIYIF